MSQNERHFAPASDRPSRPTFSVSPEPGDGDAVYRAVTALRADPRLTSFALVPDFYLAAANPFPGDDERPR